MTSPRPDMQPSNVWASPASRIFVTFRRWPFVPSAELYRLQSTLTECGELADLDSAQDLLKLVNDELARRTAETLGSGE